MHFDEVKKSIQWGQETLTLETGKVARQADGSVIATLGETSVMANVTFAKEPKPGQDFFPLTVHYQEKYYAAGKVPGGFFKREARPTEKETLTARLIDRPCRPLFAPGFKNEVLVMCTVLSHDLVNDPDIVAMIAALVISLSMLAGRTDGAGDLCGSPLPLYRRRIKRQVDMRRAPGQRGQHVTQRSGLK